MVLRATHNPHSKSTSTVPSKRISLITRLVKFVITIYLIASVAFTAYTLFLRPLGVIFVTRDNVEAGSRAAAASATLKKSSPVAGSAPQISVRPLPDGSAGSLDVAVKMEKRPLKGAAVDEEAVRAEDAGSLWGRKKGRHGHTSTLSLERAPAKLRTLVGDPIPPRAAVDGFDPSLSSIAWHSPVRHLPLGAAQSSSSVPGSREVTTEDLFLSKAFDESLGPSKVVPYYYKATGPPGAGGSEGKGPLAEDITITTLVTSNRFKVFEKLVEHYQGPISATIHVSNDPQRLHLMLENLDEMYRSSPYMSMWVDIHLIVDAFDRQFNMWRNVAKFFARTDYVMMLDVDFWLCTDFRSRVLASEAIMSRLRAGTAAFVIPAFEYTKQRDGVDPSTFPTDKAALVETVKSGKLGMFHKSWQPGHGATNYTHYYRAQPGEVYRAHGYTHSYEPYVIFKKEGTPYCDERFIGYGGNKAACLFELYLSGVSYYVLADDFVIHQSHAYAEAARKHERRYNRKLYADFREETCFRYLTQMVDSGAIGTSKASNMLTECKKIKGFSNAAARLNPGR